jgi:hypothetical protein
MPDAFLKTVKPVLERFWPGVRIVDRSLPGQPALLA